MHYFVFKTKDGFWFAKPSNIVITYVEDLDGEHTYLEWADGKTATVQASFQKVLDEITKNRGGSNE